jgi:hypothetical protein
MTPTERAENIKAMLLPLIDLGPSIVGFIATQIEAAEREAVDSLIEKQVLCIGDDPLSKKIYAEGFAAGEKAAGK